MNAKVVFSSIDIQFCSNIFPIMEQTCCPHLRPQLAFFRRWSLHNHSWVFTLTRIIFANAWARHFFSSKFKWFLDGWHSLIFLLCPPHTFKNNIKLANDLLFFLFLYQLFFKVGTPHSIYCVTVASDIFLYPFLRSSCICIPIRVSFDFRRLFNWFRFLVTLKSAFIYFRLETALFELFLFTLCHGWLIFEVWGFLFT